MSLAVISTRAFPTRYVLSVATQTIPDSRWMPEIYQLLEYLTGGRVTTAQLSEAMRECSRFLVFRHPSLLDKWEPGLAHDADSLRIWFTLKQAEEGASLVVMRN